jgi:hypothetical protein
VVEGFGGWGTVIFITGVKRRGRGKGEEEEEEEAHLLIIK